MMGAIPSPTITYAARLLEPECHANRIWVGTIEKDHRFLIR
jgi:hypothetical protein